MERSWLEHHHRVYQGQSIDGVPMVTSDLTNYKNSFLYALALHWQVEVKQMDLDEMAAAAAF